MTDIDAGEVTAVRRRPPGGATTNLTWPKSIERIPRFYGRAVVWLDGNSPDARCTIGFGASFRQRPQCADTARS